MTPGLAPLARDILARAQGARRYIVAVAGAPGSGKSTFAGDLIAALEAEAPGASALMPMDGFHLDNAVLDQRGLRARKGAPETFDVDGLAVALDRVRAATGPVALPVFDRELDLARAGARIVGPDQPVIVLEGNYVLLRDPPWSDLAPLLDRTLFLPVAEDELARRLTARWLHYGLSPGAAEARALDNDIPNARLVAARSRAADVIWRG